MIIVEQRTVYDERKSSIIGLLYYLMELENQDKIVQNYPHFFYSH